MFSKLRNRARNSKPNLPPPTGYVMEGNTYKDRWAVGLTVMGHELKRWRDSIDNKENLANVKKACSLISNAYEKKYRKLDLSSLKLTSLPASCMALLQNLQSLNLRGNCLNTIKSNGIDKLDNLVNLDLSRNRLTEITGLANLHKITSLDISYNLRLIDLRELLVFPDSVVYKIIMSSIRGTTCKRDGELFALPRIAEAIKSKDENLDLSFTGLCHIPPYIQLVRNLKQLNLSRNHFDTLKGIELISPFLKSLNLSNCDLDTLDGVGSLTSLTELDVSRNNLTRVNNTLTLLPNLQKLHSGGNKLQETPIIAASRSNRIFRAIRRPFTNSDQLTASMNSISSSSGMSFADYNPLENFNCQSIFPLLGAPYNGLKY